MCSPESLMTLAVLKKHVRAVKMLGVCKPQFSFLDWYFAICKQKEVLGMIQKLLYVVLRFSGHGHTRCWDGSC